MDATLGKENFIIVSLKANLNHAFSVWSYVLCAYWGLSFILLHMSKIHTFHTALNYSMHFVLLGTFIILQFSGIVHVCKTMERTSQKAFSSTDEASGPQKPTSLKKD